MPTDEEVWMAYLVIAQQYNPGGPLAAPNGLRGRSLAKAVHIANRLWGFFRQYLIPYLPPTVIAALDVLELASGLEVYINPPGPQ